MKRLFYMVVLLLGISMYAQDFERIDATILLYPKTFNAPEDLSRFITRDFVTDEEKVRAMYSWIVQNIAYEPDEYKQFDFKFKNYRERNQKEEKTREKVIRRTLQKGIAVCEGYAMLLEKLCELQGISNYLVRGDTKSNFDDIGRPFAKNHMWNVIFIEGKPFLFDPTWGAGRYNGKFIKEPSYFYYKTPPDLFFKTHYPEMLEDAYIDKIVSREVFSSMPLIISEKLKIEDVESPVYGIINSNDYYESVGFTINNCNPEGVSYSYGKEKRVLETVERMQGRLKFEIPLELGVDKLLIYFDDKPALGYKIE